MANGILGLIAQPQIANVPGQFQAGQQSALQRRLLESQLAGQQQENVAQQNVLGQRQALTESVGTPQFQSNLQRFAAQTAPPQTIQSVFEGISDQNLKAAFTTIGLASTAPEADQNVILEAAKQNFEGKPAFQQAITDIQNAPAEKRAEMFQKINNLGQQLGVLEALPTPGKTPEQIERELVVKEGTLKLSKEKAAAGDITVGAQEILEDGTVIQSTPKGIRVFNPEGQQVKGAEAREAIATARAEKVSNLRKAAGGKKTAALEAQRELEGLVAADVISKEEAAKTSIKAFDRLEKINTNIGNINEAINLIDQGAQTGAIVSKFPSIKEASVKLDNLQGRLGLDVIGNTTFGALSEAELRFALDTALPQKLKGTALKKWLIEKRDAQEKLSDYIEASAIYLGTPGNTVSGWIQKQKLKSTSAPVTQVLNFDSQGNQIQ